MALLPAAGKAPTSSTCSARAPEDVAVGVERQAHRHPVVAGVLAGHQVLAAVLDPLHRPAEALAGEHDGQLLGDHEHLLAEPAADVAHHHPHAVLRQAEGPGRGSRGRRAAPWVEVCTTSSLRKPSQMRHHAAALHRHAQVAVLVERLGDDVGRRREDGVELGIGCRRDGAVDVARRGRGARAGRRRRARRRGRRWRRSARCRRSMRSHGVLGEVAGLGDDQRDRARRRSGRRPRRGSGTAGRRRRPRSRPTPRCTSPLRSAPVNTATTPGSSRAAVTSSVGDRAARRRRCAGRRRAASRARTTSSTYVPWPVTQAGVLAALHALADEAVPPAWPRARSSTAVMTAAPAGRPR